VLFLVIAAALGWYVADLTRQAPGIEALTSYNPPLTTQLYSADSRLIAEYSVERRRYLKSDEIPDLVKRAFIAAEDKKFFAHNGLDYPSILRAIWQNVIALGSSDSMVGASTITQQMVKNVLVGGEKTIDRKVAEALLAWRAEEQLEKNQILEIYLNEVFLGLRSFGLAEASYRYFGKSVRELTLAEAAYLAGLPKAPSRYHPLRFPGRAAERRNWVIDRMVENGFVSADEGQLAKGTELVVTLTSPAIYRADYFTGEARRELSKLFGQETVYHGGLSVRTSLDPALQEMAQTALANGLIKYDVARGWRGPVARIDNLDEAWLPQFADAKPAPRLRDWHLAVVLSVTKKAVRVGLRMEGTHDRVGSPIQLTTGIIPLDRLGWARWAVGKRRGRGVRAAGDVLQIGDIIYVEPAAEAPGEFELRQIPELGGGLVALDPHTGRVFAVVGGFSFDDSQFNRATQALRQPGSSFKPFIYAAALENGYTPSTIVRDAPIAIDRGDGLGAWRPKNYSGKFYGPLTLRAGLERSRNVLTVRLAQQLGMGLVADTAVSFGVYDRMEPFPALALGASETTLLRMAAAYATFANGGRRTKPTFVDNVFDRNGAVIYAHKSLKCVDCSGQAPGGRGVPTGRYREQIISQTTAYQMTSLLEGVVQRGTGRVVRALGRPVAGKTGTTNDHRDAWFVGFTPDLVVGVFVGFDNPRTIAGRATGGQMAAPIFTEFMQMALADRPPTSFSVPATVELAYVNRRTGRKVKRDGPGTILEAFNSYHVESKPVGLVTSNMMVELDEEDEGADFEGTSPSGVKYTVLKGGKFGSYVMGGKIITYRIE
jgi:penicillin-binding protein 1A